MFDKKNKTPKQIQEEKDNKYIDFLYSNEMPDNEKKKIKSEPKERTQEEIDAFNKFFNRDINLDIP